MSFQASSEKARAESEAGVVARSSLLMWPLLLVIAGTTLPLASDDEVKKSLLPSRYADAVKQILFYLFSFLPIPLNFFFFYNRVILILNLKKLYRKRYKSFFFFARVVSLSLRG